MGLSSKQVSCNGLDWSQTLLQAPTLELSEPHPMRRQQQSEPPLKCPRCDSSNTKFCYYNNYNKSQPRHFCKACKRHWTQGGTLRNVPVGGGRKNKRLKTSKISVTTTSTTRTSNGNIINKVNPHIAIQVQEQKQNAPLAFGAQKTVSQILHQALIYPPSSVLQQINSVSCNGLDNQRFSTNRNGVFLGSTWSVLRNQELRFPYSSSSSFDTHPSSISTPFQSSDVYNYTGEAMEDSTITTVMPTTNGTGTDQPWQVSNISSGMDMTNDWNWDDLDISTDLNIPWDDSEIKP